MAGKIKVENSLRRMSAKLSAELRAKDGDLFIMVIILMLILAALFLGLTMVGAASITLKPYIFKAIQIINGGKMSYLQ